MTRLFPLLFAAALPVWIRWDAGQLPLQAHEANSPFLYGWILGQVHSLGLSANVIRALIWTSGSFFLWATYALARTSVGPLTALLTMVALAFSPLVLTQLGVTRPELPMAAIALWVIFFLLRRSYKTASILFAIAALIGPSILFLLPVYLYLYLQPIELKQWKDGWVRSFFFLLPTLVLLGVWWFFHQSQFHLPRFIDPVEHFPAYFQKIFVQDGRFALTVAVMLGAFFKLMGWAARKAWSPFEKALLAILALITLVLSVTGVVPEGQFLIAVSVLFILGANGLQTVAGLGRLFSFTLLPVMMLALLAVAGYLSWIGSRPNPIP